jgi:pilus assembly protein Flp/PilA
MSHQDSLVLRLILDEEGPTAVEYAVMLALIIVGCVAVVTSIGSTSSSSFNKVYTTLSS